MFVSPQDPLDIDIDTLLAESARVAAEYDASENEAEHYESNQQDLQDRQALRRIAGLSTELQDISDAEYRQLRLEKVVLIGVWTEGTILDAENSMKELSALAETAGSQVMDALIQRRDRADPSTFIGSGKVVELKQIVAATGADTVVCDGELSPAQLRSLEQKVKVKVIDRTALILDIFAQHAKSREGKAQVELAQMTYLLPRLRGWGDSLSRQAGGIGGRGPGETKIETDRRRINDKMAKLKKEIKEMKVARDTKRQERTRHQIPSVSIAGYTNAGKSSLMNRLTGAGVLVENALFATLDPTTRKVTSNDGRIYTLSDTVGFVRHLPHQLVEAFKSTLEEVAGSDLIVHVVDGSHADPKEQIRAVRQVINEIGAGDVLEIIAINKSDIASPEVMMQLLREEPNSFAFSARTGFGVDTLLAAIEGSLPRPRVEISVVIPFTRGDLVSAIHERGQILSEEYLPEGTSIHAMVDGALAQQISDLQ
ncbi:MAG: GTPase HflX [Actinobacteria bacterium]|nr:GTPase HflX [Actinomycetota bacterium]MSW14713.1 GTPase HflX [Actinomycetota bacterium]MSY82139.1 GTPase HflX [Actinomycetota bacterium]MSZ45488.1 GTPase HflX [Actinomycetota bacterium]MTA04355.1 GTPase HflX [Actinomycetota bacterium]